MIETILASLIVGQVIQGPNVIRTDYLNLKTNQVISVQEIIQEVPSNE